MRAGTPRSPTTRAATATARSARASRQARWIERRMERVLPTHSFHVVFTLPSELHALVLVNREAALRHALRERGRDPARARSRSRRARRRARRSRASCTPGRASSASTRTCIASSPAAASRSDGERWVGARPDFLFPVRVLGALFRGKFLARLATPPTTRGELRLRRPRRALADPARLRTPSRQAPSDAMGRLLQAALRRPRAGLPLPRPLHPSRRPLESAARLRSTIDSVTFRTRGERTVTVCARRVPPSIPPSRPAARLRQDPTPRPPRREQRLDEARRGTSPARRRDHDGRGRPAGAARLPRPAPRADRRRSARMSALPRRSHYAPRPRFRRARRSPDPPGHVMIVLLAPPVALVDGVLRGVRVEARALHANDPSRARVGADHPPNPARTRTIAVASSLRWPSRAPPTIPTSANFPIVAPTATSSPLPRSGFVQQDVYPTVFPAPPAVGQTPIGWAAAAGRASGVTVQCESAGENDAIKAARGLRGRRHQSAG